MPKQRPPLLPLMLLEAESCSREHGLRLMMAAAQTGTSEKGLAIVVPVKPVNFWIGMN